MKEEIKSNLDALAGHEKHRLLIEMDKTKNLDNERKFYKFTNILDKQRKVYIGDYLPEWGEYFKNSEPINPLI